MVPKQNRKAQILTGVLIAAIAAFLIAKQRGITPEANGADARRGLGLMGMRERAQTLNGRFVLTNRPEGGTRIVVTLPVGPHADAARMAG